MRGANMSVVGRVVVKRLVTRTTSVRVFGEAFVVCLKMAIESGFLCEAFVTAGTFVGFLPSMDSLVSFKAIQTSKGLVAGVTTMFLALFLGRWLPITGLNILQLSIVI